MSDIRIAQDMVLDGAQAASAAAIGALDSAKGAVEELDRAHLMVADDYWEAVSALDSTTTLLEEFREHIREQLEDKT